MMGAAIYDPAVCARCVYNIGRNMPRIMEEMSADEIEGCLLPELTALWNAGIETRCSCCGHGIPEHAHIVVRPEYRQAMIEQGYEEIPATWEGGCAECGVFFRAKLPAGLIGFEYTELAEGEKPMYDVKPITSPKPNDCGATCLQMLLAYYGTDVDLDTLVEECDTGIGGCSAADIMRVGSAHGLSMRAYRMDAEELIRQDRPSIIHWKGNHFVVCCGTDSAGKVVICNPDRGRFGMPKATFAAMYSGVALFDGVPETQPPAETDVEQLQNQVSMLTDCLLEMSEIVYGG